MNLLESNRIQGLLENKIHFLEELLTCSKMLADLPYVSHEAEYSNLLKTREKCIDALKSLENTLQDYSESTKGIVPIQTVNKTITALNDQVAKLIQEILVLDKRNIASISGQMQNVKSKIKALGRGRKGVVGYQAGQRLNVAGAFTDSRK